MDAEADGGDCDTACDAERDDVDDARGFLPALRREPCRDDEVEGLNRNDRVETYGFDEDRRVSAGRGHPDHRDEEDRACGAMQTRAFAQHHGQQPGKQRDRRGEHVSDDNR